MDFNIAAHWFDLRFQRRSFSSLPSEVGDWKHLHLIRLFGSGWLIPCSFGGNSLKLSLPRVAS